MQALSYYQRNKNRILRELRQTRLTTAGNVVIRHIKKSPRPNRCPLCHRTHNVKDQPIRLEWHHWIETYPEIGVWLCWDCHRFAEYLDKFNCDEIILHYRFLQEEAKRKFHEILT